MTLRCDDVQLPAAERERNRARRDGRKHADECFLCGRGLTARAVERGFRVALRTNGCLIAVGEEVPPAENQGSFPVGSECAKRVSAAYRYRSPS